MRHMASKLVLLLLLGAIINVAVAWGFAIRAYVCANAQWYRNPTHSPSIKYRCIREVPIDWPADPPSGWYSCQTIDEIRTWGYVHSWATDYFGTGPLGRTVHFMSIHACGWPRLAVRTIWVAPSDNWERERSSSDVVVSIDGGISWPTSGPRFRLDPRGRLPLIPIWPGFAINTIFYAAVLWLPVAGLGALRRHGRVKGGLCPSCAYPIGGSPICTECGASVATRDSVL